METKTLPKFRAQWFQRPDGTYLSLSEHIKSEKIIHAFDLECAIEAAKEFEIEDSEIPFLERVSVGKIDE